MKKVGIAFDKASVRTFDADGRMHVAKTHISKANVCPYYGREIPGAEQLGLEPNKVYKLYRDPAELEKGASTFNRLPLLRKHIQISADAPMKEEVVGSIGSDASFEAPYLDASLCIWDSEAIAGIEAGQIEELSSAYRYVPVMEPGVSPDGESYDGRMTEIRANHLALVERGRAGSDVVVADSNPFPKESTVKKTKLGHALTVALSAASAKLAQDSALPKLVGGAVKKTFDKAAVLKSLIAMDEDLDQEQASEILDAVVNVETTPEPVEPKPLVEDTPLEPLAPAGNPEHAKIIDFLRSKGLPAPELEAVGEMLSAAANPLKAQDEEVMKKEEVDAKVEAAMDGMRVEFRALEAAKSAVRTTVGDVIGMDSAEQVYRFALDHLKVDHKDMPAAGLGRLFAVASDRKAAPSPRIATDSASVAKIPGLDRFRSI